MDLLLIISACLISIGTIFALYIFWGFRWRDLLFFAALMLPNVWLSRFELHFWEAAPGIPFGMTWFVFAGIGFIFILLGYHETRLLFMNASFKLILLMLLLLMVLSLSSVVGAGEAVELVRGFHALCFIIVPFFAAYFIVRSCSIDNHYVSCSILSFYIMGLFLGSLSLLTAFAPGLFGGFVGTYKTATDVGRSFAPIGGPSVVSMCLMLVYFIALGQLMAKRLRILSTIVLAICFVGILTSQARAALFAFILSNLYFFGRYFSGFGRRILILLIIGSIILTPLTYFVNKKYSLERFTRIGAGEQDKSLTTRAESFKTAAKYGTRRFAFGGGWGHVYTSARVVYALAGTPETIYLDGMESAFKPHSLFALVYAESGGLALVVLVLFFLAGWKALKPPDYHVYPYANNVVHGLRSGFLSFSLMCVAQDHLFLTTKLPLLFYLFLFMAVGINSYFNLEITYSQWENNQVEESSLYHYQEA